LTGKHYFMGVIRSGKIEDFYGPERNTRNRRKAQRADDIARTTRRRFKTGDWKKAMLRRLTVIAALALLLGTASCSGAVGTVQTTTNKLEPITVPTLPANVPGYLEVDPDTGLHMTGTPTVVDFASYRLKVSGRVARELSLTYDELRLLPMVTATTQLVCQGFFVDTATWSGAPLKTIIEMAGVQSGATSIIMKSADGYSATLNLEEALAPDNFLAYELAGQTLPVLQGFPLRAVIPDKNGFVWVKWLLEIVVQ
jgi:DMSO/TMAO reductase YedYZ molybdopterin-dependent catalytic subunit